ncbi:MAG: hypothetical protein AB1921_03350 [Thermodesulfobacteriota bacterium]
MPEECYAILSHLRQTGNMQWYVVPLLVFVIYVYVTEMERKNYATVYLSLAFFFAEALWEMFNAFILSSTGYAPLWGTPGGNSAFIIYAGLNIEIAFFFAVSGIILIKSLPENKETKILGVANRVFVPVAYGLFAVFVEVLLNQAGLLTWRWSFWKWPNIWLIIIAYCLPFYALVWCHDHWSTAQKKKAAQIFFVLAVLCHLVFASVLGII